ncbi:MULTISPECIES: phage tail tape measure protein [Serratia]|nr:MULTISPECIES: phage tail tape measure protein [Serratia]RYM62601.1 phage tail tape measure protein [Serratia proteamaculans]CAI1862118.1 phage tail tape measure protein, TP901 family, core region [Serratia quinivorans]
MKQLDFTLSLIDKMTRPLKQAQSAVGNFAEKSQGNFRQIGVGAAAIWGVTQSIKAMLGPAYEMQHALDELSLRGVDTKALNTLASDANRFSIRYGKNAVEFVASASAIKGSIAGLTDTELPRYVIAANTLAAATKTSAEDASGFMGAMYNQFKSTADKMGKVQFAEKLADQGAYMVKTFGMDMATVQDMLVGSKGEGSNYGIGMEEQFAVLGELNRTMGSEGAGAYEQFLKTAQAGAQSLGLSFTDATGKMMSMPDMLEKLQGKYGKTIEGNIKAQAALDKAFGEGANVIKQLYDNVGDLRKNMDAMGNAQGMKHATEMAEKMADPWQRLVALWNAINTTIGRTLLPVLNPVLAKITAIGERFAKWADMFPNISRWIGYIVLGLLSLAAVGAVITVLAGLFSLLTSPILLVIVALGALAWAVYDQYQYWSWAFSEIGKDLTALWGQIVGVWDSVTAYFSGVWASLTLGWQMVVNFFTGLSPLAAFKGFATAITNVFSGLWDYLKSAFNGTYNWIVGKLNHLPGVNIALKDDTPPGAQGPAQNDGPSTPQVLTGGQAKTVGQGGIGRQLSQANNNNSKKIENNQNIGRMEFNVTTPLSPQQLQEYQEMYG